MRNLIFDIPFTCHLKFKISIIRITSIFRATKEILIVLARPVIKKLSHYHNDVTCVTFDYYATHFATEEI